MSFSAIKKIKKKHSKLDFKVIGEFDKKIKINKNN